LGGQIVTAIDIRTRLGLAERSAEEIAGNTAVDMALRLDNAIALHSHLHRYLSEFDFRYSNRLALGVDDVMRTMRPIKGAEGKRLTYRRAHSAGIA
jgi:hypothetical protein